jgi:hypothetical protein
MGFQLIWAEHFLSLQKGLLCSLSCYEGHSHPSLDFAEPALIEID